MSQHDLIDQTPVLDVKPYLPFSDSAANAVLAPWVPIPAAIKVDAFALTWSEAALAHLRDIRLEFYTVLELDLFKVNFTCSAWSRVQFTTMTRSTQDTVSHLLSLNPRSRYWQSAYGKCVVRVNSFAVSCCACVRVNW